MITVPVDMGSHYEGFAKSTGIIELHDESLVLNLQSRDSVFGVLKSKVKKIAIPFDVIEEIVLKTSLFSCKLEIRLTDFEILSEIPNSKDGRVRLKVSKRHRTDAEEIQSICSLAISDSRIRRISELMEKNNSST